MIGSSFLPTRFRGEPAVSKPVAPNWISKKVNPLLQFLARLACSHPIHTVVVVAVLASTSYVGIIQESLRESTASVSGKADWSSLLDGSRSLQISPDTAWQWQNVEHPNAVHGGDVEHLALLTLVFPDTLSNDSPSTAPRRR